MPEARDQPIQSYYPSARARLIIRFEDYGANDTPEPPELPGHLRSTNTSDAANLRVVEQDGVLILAGPGDDPGAIGSPQEQWASLDDRTHVVDGIIPRAANHARNNSRIADTLECTIKFRDFPLDPRTIRSCAIQYYLGCVSPEDFAAGLAGETRSTKSASVMQGLNVVPDDFTDAHGQLRSNKRFEGWLDDYSSDHPNSDGPVVTLRFTDNTRILIEQDHPPKLGVGVDVPIDRAVADYLANFPQFRGLQVVYLPADETPPTMKDVLSKQAYVPGVGPQHTSGGDSKTKVWDYLTDVVGSLGLGIRMRGVQVVIQRARTLFAGSTNQRVDDTFRPRTLPGGRELPRRTMIYGRNVFSMSAQRPFTTYTPENVEVRCYSPRRKRTLIARYPELVKRVKDLKPGQTAEKKFIVLRVSGVEDEVTLGRIAQQVYELRNRGELVFNVVSKNLASFGEGNADPDLLDLEYGDAVDLEVLRVDPTAFGEQNTANMVQWQVATRPEEFLRSLGFPEAFAKAYARAANNVAFPTTFRVREVHTDWDAEAEGVVIDFDLVNYVEARVDPEAVEGT